MAYEVKALVEELKAEGVELAEEAAVKVVKGVSQWAQKEAAKGEHGVVDAVVLIAAPQFEKLATDLADKIDGEEDRA